MNTPADYAVVLCLCILVCLYLEGINAKKRHEDLERWIKHLNDRLDGK